MRKKSWWDDELEQRGMEVVKSWLSWQIEKLKKLKEFKIISLDSSNKKYETIEFPPKLEDF